MTPSAPLSFPEALRFAPDIADRLKQLPATRIDFDRSLIPATEAESLRLLIDASRVVEEIFVRQVDEGNPALRQRLEALVRERRPGSITALEYFDANLGPWDRLKGDEPFIGTRPKPKGAAFYPPDMTKEEFERWIAAHPQDHEAFQSLFTVIRRDGDRLVAVPYSKYYPEPLTRVAERQRSSGIGFARRERSYPPREDASR